MSSSLSKPTVKIAPSMLASNFASLTEEAKTITKAGADYLHIDCIDGHFCPNLTVGPPVLASLHKSLPDLFYDCHLMVSNPLQWVVPMAKAGCSLFTFHLEATDDVLGVIKCIKDNGMKCGIAIKPATPIESVYPYVDSIDQVLIMTVEPGFGGQSFMSDMLPKMSTLRAKYPSLDIQVDGGIGLQNIEAIAKAGANVIVAGTSIFKADSPADVISSFKSTITQHQK